MAQSNRATQRAKLNKSIVWKKSHFHVARVTIDLSNLVNLRTDLFVFLDVGSWRSQKKISFVQQNKLECIFGKCVTNAFLEAMDKRG